jgi:DNA-binding GntR family transcriptional regulator
MSAPMSAPLEIKALYQEVADRLRDMIFAHELQPGQWVDEQKLAEGFGISRTPLREALKALVAEGLIELRPRRGSFVRELTQNDIDQLFPLMAMLEGRCAYEAVKRATPADVKKLEDLHLRLEKLAANEQRTKYFELNYAFHALVQELAANAWLQRITTDLRQFLRLLRGRQLHLPGRLEASIAEHRALLAAFQAGNPEAADAAMRNHLLAQHAALQAYDRTTPAEAVRAA